MPCALGAASPSVVRHVHVPGRCRALPPRCACCRSTVRTERPNKCHPRPARPVHSNSHWHRAGRALRLTRWLPVRTGANRQAAAGRGTNAGGKFKRYEGYLPAAREAVHSRFTITKTATAVTLATSKGASVSLETARPVSTFAVGGRVVSKLLRPAERKAGVDCIAPGWEPLEKGQAAALGPGGTGCLRLVRSLGEGEDIYGFGQAPVTNLSAVGQALMMVASSRNDPDGRSHAPAPFYISLAKDGRAHGLLLNTNRYSMWDVGRGSGQELRIHTGDPTLEYYLFIGPTPVDVLRQMARKRSSHVTMGYDDSGLCGSFS